MSLLGLPYCPGFSLVAASGATLCHGEWASHCGGFSCCGARVLENTGSSCCPWGSVAVASRLWSTGSVAVMHGFSGSAACGIFSDQGWNSCLLHWQVGSLPLS